MTPDEVSKAFKAWSTDDSSHPNVLHSSGVEIHKGRQVYKWAGFRAYGDKVTGVVSKRSLEVGSVPVKEFGAGYDFEHPVKSWSCDTDEEIDRVRAFLSDEFNEPGLYVRVQQGTDVASVIEALQQGQVDAASIASVVEALARVPGVTEMLADTDLAQVFTGAVEQARQRRGVATLREAVENPSSSEGDLQKILEEHWWVFGSRYVDATARRKLTLLDEFDIPLIRGDGALHIVELKKANYSKLVVPHRKHMAVGPEVHLAVSQAQNYLAALDRQETVIKAELGLDCRRAFATVVIGHSMFTGGYRRDEISEVLRIYNSHLSRVEVITYEELVDGAERALNIVRAPEQDEGGDPPVSEPASEDPWVTSSDPWSTPAASYDEPPF